MSYLLYEHKLSWWVHLLSIVFLVHPPALNALQKVSIDNTGITSQNEGYVELVDAVSSAVVQVRVERFGGAGRLNSDENTSLLSRSLKTASGIIVDSTGYIVTNAHVVQQAKSVRIMLPYRENYNPDKESILHPQGKILNATIVGTDRETDIAVLKIDAGKQPYLTFGDSDDLRSGQLVFAFGSPRGLENSVSMGIVSATARQLRPEDPMIYIQTDAPINPGNSGGPLIDGNGKVVGINTLNLSESGGSEGLGFAAPSNIVKDIYTQIKQNGRVKRGVIGVHVQTIGPRLAEGLQVRDGYRVVISDVLPGSPADVIGLKPGDIVKSMDGKFMENARQLNVNIYGKSIGSYIDLTVVRDDKELTKKVKVVGRDEKEARFMEYVKPEENFVELLGVLVVELNSEIRDMLPMLRSRGGVLIAGSNGKADVMGDPLKPGDVIYRADDNKIDSFQEFKHIVTGKSPGEVLVLYVEREGTLLYLSYEI